MRARRKPFTLKVSKSSVTFSPLKASWRNRSVSRMRRYWFSKAIPFQLATITSDEAPSPQAKRPGAASAMEARLWASSAGPRV